MFFSEKAIVNLIITAFLFLDYITASPLFQLLQLGENLITAIIRSHHCPRSSAG